MFTTLLPKNLLNFLEIPGSTISSVQSLSRVRFFATPWIAAHQASLSITNSQSLLKLMPIESVMPSSHLISVAPFSSCPQSLPASGFFPLSQLFAWGGQSIGVSASASVLPMNTQDWSHYRISQYQIQKYPEYKTHILNSHMRQTFLSIFSLYGLLISEALCLLLLSRLSRVWLCATPWTIAHQDPPSMGFSRQEYWSGLPCPPPGDLPHPGIEPATLMSPALAGQFFITSTTWEAQGSLCYVTIIQDDVKVKDWILGG